MLSNWLLGGCPFVQFFSHNFTWRLLSFWNRRKVASISGDCRRALDICRRATEIAESDCSGKKVMVSMLHVQRAFNEMITNPKVLAIKGCSKYEKFFLQAVEAEVGVRRFFLFNSRSQGQFSRIQILEISLKNFRDFWRIRIRENRPWSELLFWLPSRLDSYLLCRSKINLIICANFLKCSPHCKLKCRTLWQLTHL